MTEQQISAFDAHMRSPGINLHGKLCWRQRVIDALIAKRDEWNAKVEPARIQGDGAAEHEANAHSATLSGFIERAKYGGNWKNWLYMVELSADEAAWLGYVANCEAEGLDAHGLQSWMVHGKPAEVI